jgi:hypothetical protein
VSTVSRRRAFLGGALLFLSLVRAAAAREVEGVVFPDEVRLGQNALLRLAGAGVFRFFFMRYYVCGLYLAEGVSGVDAAVQSDRPRRVELVALRRIGAFEFLWGLDRGVADNSSEKELKALAAPLGGLRDAIRSIGTLAAGARVAIDYLPEAGTRLVVDNQLRGGPFAGKALNDALIKVWIGQRPLDASLKEVLLGG